MRLVVGDGTKVGSSVEVALREICSQSEGAYKYYKLAEMDIKPCYNCGACLKKHPGRCAVKDESDQLILEVLEREGVMWVTPIFLGGYNGHTKKAVDKLVRTGNPLFQMVDGRIQHMSYRSKQGRKDVYIGIGVADEKTTEKEKEDFKMLIKENGMVSVSHAICSIIEPTDTKDMMIEKLKLAMGEGEQMQ